MNTGPRIPRRSSRGQTPSTPVVPRDPACANDASFGMWEPEQAHPWVRWVHLAVVLGTILLSHFKPWGFAA
jgi:hypothetical protein